MNSTDFTTTILVDQTPEEVFECVNNPRAWWSDSIEGDPERLNAEWKYQFGDNHRSKMKTIELVRGKSVVWLVEDNYFKGAKDQTEWVGNEIRFEISKQNGKTQMVFKQIGLIPDYTCYKACDWAWTGFIQQSLFSLITTGKGDLAWYEKR